MFETQMVRRHDKFRKEWSQHKNKCKSQMRQDQVSEGVSVLCWLTASKKSILILRRSDSFILKFNRIFYHVQSEENIETSKKKNLRLNRNSDTDLERSNE